MARWAFAVVALHKQPRKDAAYGNNVFIRHFVGILDAISKDEALGKTVGFGQRFYRVDKGWADHSFSVEHVDNTTDLDTATEAPIP